METVGILAVLEAKPGKEKDVEAFLKSALPLAQAESQTARWYAVKLGPSTFGIFDTFADQSGRDAHLKGEIAKALCKGGRTAGEATADSAGRHSGCEVSGCIIEGDDA